MLPNVDTPSARLARALLRDRDNKQQPSSWSPSCFACGRSYSRGDGRFCSTRCRETFDAGIPAHEPIDIKYSLPKGRHGFLIDCAHCRRQFDSPGWRCCSTDCAREYRRKQALEAELADYPFRVVKPKCLQCGQAMPLWKNGKRVTSARKFCSPRCQKRHAQSAALAQGEQTPLSGVQTAKKCPSNGLRQTGHAAASPSAEQPA
jgi:hypothetical protein